MNGENYERIGNYCSNLKCDVLSVEEEAYYGEIIQAGGEDAEDAIQIMWESNLRLVVRIVMQEFSWVNNGSVSTDDLISVGNMGLRKAVCKFDPHHGNKFATYARWYILKEIEEALARNGNSSGFISMPAAAANRIKKIRAAKWKYKISTGEDPTDEKIAELTNIPIGTVKSMIDMCEWHRGDIEMAGDINECYDTRFEENETAESIVMMRRAMTLLKPIEAYIIIMRNGLTGKEETLEEISQKINRSGERVRQIQRDADKKLGDIMRSGCSVQTEEIDYYEVIDTVMKEYQQEETAS